MSSKEERRSSTSVKSLIDEISAEIERNPVVSRAISEVNNFAREVAGFVAYPPVDVIEDMGRIIVTVDLPGVAAENTRVTLEGNILTLKAQRPARTTIGGETVHRKERPEKIVRKVYLPIHVEKGEKVDAKTRMKDGVLEIEIGNPQTNIINLQGASRQADKKSD
ncbi:MAG: Hsp20/alpha crystallin family protein [Nitrososphaera sp.]|jgi:HSP20 family molecular chaperone IbpA